MVGVEEDGELLTLGVLSGIEPFRGTVVCQKKVRTVVLEFRPILFVKGLMVPSESTDSLIKYFMKGILRNGSEQIIPTEGSRHQIIPTKGSRG